MIQKKIAVLIALPAALALSGCLGPAYKRPAVETPATYKEAADAAQWQVAKPGDAVPKGEWWKIFGDDKLDELELKIAVSNQSVAQAQAQYREALELVSINRSAYLPTIATNPSAQRGYGGSGTAAHTYTDNFQLPLTAAWEPDLWGQIRQSVAGAKAAAQASAATLENVRLSLQAQLAIDYFSLQELDMEETLLNSSTGSYVEALMLTKTRFAHGVAAETDVDQAQTQLDSTRAQATDVALRRAQLEHAIAVLVGQAPASFSLSTGTIQAPPPPIPAVLPAQLLERRPDIATAERAVAAANANVGLARTAYFPAIDLAGAIGYEAGNAAHWFDWPNRFWSIGASAAETIFDFGKRRAEQRQVNAAYDAAVAAYRQTVLSAFQEVEDNLSALALLSQEGVQQDSAAKAAETSLKLELDRYKAGIVSYLDVIQSQNIALTNERAAAQVLGRRLTSAVVLIRAVGGGWDASQMPYVKQAAAAPAAKR